MAFSRTLLLTLPMLVIAGCSKPAPAPSEIADNSANGVMSETNVTDIPEDGDAVNAPEAATGNSTVGGWAGRWTGPEGLFLDIKPAKDGSPDHMALTIKDNLDTQGDYEGTIKGDTIVFARAGKAETIKAGTGAQTGFKWLAEKKDCLIVIEGKEGYCR